MYLEPKLLLSDEDAARIRLGIEDIRGPILLKWIRQLLDDRELRVAWLDELLPGNHAERVRLEREKNVEELSREQKAANT
jgi:hypothetical protein